MPGNFGPLELFGDFGMAGGEDVAPNPAQNNQICINFYAEANKQNPKEILGLLGCPGLIQVAAAPGGGAPAFDASTTAWAQPSSITNLPVRGMYEIPGEGLGLAVIGNVLYLITQSPAATTTAWPGLNLTSVGTLASSSGPVVMVANNGVGYGQLGTVVGTVAIVDGQFGYYYNWLTNTFNQITEAGFLGADRVDIIDGWFIFNQPNTQAFYVPLQPYGIVFSNSVIGSIQPMLKDGSPDNLVIHFANKELLWLLGEKTTEVWYVGGGGQYIPFGRLAGSLMQVGCKAKHSVARFNSEGEDGVIWFGRSERGENVILRSRGFNPDVVSTPAFGAEVRQYPITSDAIGYTYEEDTHEFYVLTFPTADTTWVFDGQTGLLHKRLSYDPYLITPITNQFNPPGCHRHRSNCYMNFAGMRLVGDYQNGAIYWMTRSAFTDAGWPLLAKRRSPHIWDKGQRGRVFMASLQCDFTSGEGNQSGLGTNPHATLQISRDGGRTFGQRWPAPLGAAGQYKTRTMWRRLGFGRDNVVDIEVIDPVPRDLVGVTLKAFSGA